MRLRIEISTEATAIPWRNVLRPGRAVAYRLLGAAAPDLADTLHAKGWGPHGMVPFGYGAPVFPRARRRNGTYSAGGKGRLEFASPLPQIVVALLESLSRQDVLDWGGVALRVNRVIPVPPPDFGAGRAHLRTETPVTLRAPRPATIGGPAPNSAEVLPYEDGFVAAFEHNLRRKAETLGLTSDVAVERLTWVGAKRSFAVGSGIRVGAPIGVELRGEPDLLRALWSWGLGQANSAGFGWVTA